MSGGMTRFGRVEFDAARGALSVAGHQTRLDRPCVAILSLLLSEAGKEVDKDRLLQVGWPGRLVHENSLAKAIGRLRQALGEEGQVLETVHGYGYRLAVDPQPAAPPVPEARPRAAHFRRPAFAAAAAGSTAAAAAAILWLGAFASQPDSSEDLRLRRGEPADAAGRLLWVDDHPENNAVEKTYLERRRIAVYQVRSSEEALALLAMYDYRAVISDMNRNGRPLDGLDLVREMRRRQDGTPFYLYTVVPSAAQRQLLSEAGGQGATAKSEELYAAILPLFGESATRRSQ